MSGLKVIIFSCNWNAYSGLEHAGGTHHAYPPSVIPIKVSCLGELSTGIILKAFDKGADGVLLLGCPPGKCHYGFGAKYAEDIFHQARQLIRLLGYQEAQLGLDWLAAGEGEVFVEKINCFVDGLQDIKENHGHLVG
jgi:coenzyme F420-reducing hydrogenase delta subunit